jgi:hypothetical protein
MSATSEEIQGPTCEYCGSTNLVRLIPGMTAYYWDGTGEDPNRRRCYCEECAIDHVEYWTDMWAEYRASQGI